MKKVELLAPAGNMEKLKTAIYFGADAVYMGGEKFNLRALSDNFTLEEMKEAVEYAHGLGKKVYVTLNLIAHNGDLEPMAEYVKYLESIKVDGVIVADLGVFEIVAENTNLNISVSTQASNTNWRSVKMWKKLGAKRVVLAREVSLEEMKEIREKVNDIEIEAFVHGAMCMSISGRCLLSNYMTGRDANRGACAQPCRWKYNLVEEKRPNEYFPIYEDERGTYIFNSKDLCTIEFIDKILEVGIDSMKIEGRMKGIYYVANAVKVYREAIDDYYGKQYKFKPEWIEELASASNRDYTTGFYKTKPDGTAHNYETANYFQTHQMLAKVVEKIGNDEYILEIRNQVKPGESVEVLMPKGRPVPIEFPEMKHLKTGEGLSVANPNTIVVVKMGEGFQPMDIIRRRGAK